MHEMATDDIHSLFLHSDSQKFGVFTVAYSNCGKQILAGANDGCLYAYDLIGNRRVLKVPVAEEKYDVNAVGFVDETSNIFFSGTDNGIIKVITHIQVKSILVFIFDRSCGTVDALMR